MSGESVGVVAVAAIPVVIAGAAIYGIASVVNSLVEQEKANREAQRQRIEKEAGQFRLESKQALENELREIEERRQVRARAEAQKAKEDEAKRQSLMEAAERDRIMQNVSKLSVSQLDAVKEKLNISLSRLINEVDDVKEKKLQEILKAEAALLGVSIKASNVGNIEVHKSDLDVFKTRIQEIKKYGYDPEEKEKKVINIISGIEADIEDLPKAYAQFIAKDIGEVKQSISEIKDKCAGNYAFYESILKGIKLRTREAIAMAKKKWEHQEKLIDSIELEISELLICLSSPVIKDANRIAAFKREINGLYATNDIDFVQTELRRLSDEINKLYIEYLELTKNEAERNYIMNSIGDVLHHMGYEPLPIEQDIVGKNKIMEMKIPGGEAVRIALNTDKKFTAKVFRPEDAPDASYDEFRAQEEKFCSHLPELSKKMKDQGMAVKITIEKKFDASILKEVLKTKKKRRDRLKERSLD